MQMRAVRTSPLVLLLAALLWAAPALSQDDDADEQPADVQQAERIQVRDEAPDFALPDLDGEVHRLADQRGKPLVLVFFRGAW